MHSKNGTGQRQAKQYKRDKVSVEAQSHSELLNNLYKRKVSVTATVTVTVTVTVAREWRPNSSHPMSTQYNLCKQQQQHIFLLTLPKTKVCHVRWHMKTSQTIVKLDKYLIFSRFHIILFQASQVNLVNFLP